MTTTMSPFAARTWLENEIRIMSNPATTADQYASFDRASSFAQSEAGNSYGTEFTQRFRHLLSLYPRTIVDSWAAEHPEAIDNARAHLAKRAAQAINDRAAQAINDRAAQAINDTIADNNAKTVTVDLLNVTAVAEILVEMLAVCDWDTAHDIISAVTECCNDRQLNAGWTETHVRAHAEGINHAVKSHPHNQRYTPSLYERLAAVTTLMFAEIPHAKEADKNGNSNSNSTQSSDTAARANQTAQTATSTARTTACSRN